MNRLWTLPLSLILAGLTMNPAAADDDAALASELAAMRDAWLHADDATAAARLDTLRTDDRLTGALPRWYSFMRATLALQDGERDAAWDRIRPVLKDSADARNYIRAARLLLTYGELELAEKAIDAGLERKDDSPGLLRFKAGLLWLNGEHEPALDVYMKLLLADERQGYPYVAGSSVRWSELPQWDETEAKEPPEDQAEIQEPHVSLFQRTTWYPTDLPGLERCIQAVSADGALVVTFQARQERLIADARKARSALDNYRGGEVEQRTELEKEARRTTWKALLNTRVLGEASFNAGEYETAGEIAQQGLDVDYDDIALLDLVARCMGRLGKAEESRNGALASLALVAGLGLDSSTMLLSGPGRMQADRIFEPALTLYKANPEAGKAQFAALDNQFSPNSNTPIFPGVLGMWLYLRGETELAREFLLEASRFNGHDSGRSVGAAGLFTEFGLLDVGEGKPVEDAAKPAAPPGGEEVDPVEMARVGDAHPLLRKSLRVGGVMGATYPTVEMLRQLAGIDLWGGGTDISAVPGIARMLPEGDRLAFEILFGMPAAIHKEVKPDELSAFIAADHNATVTLREALRGLGESCEQYRSSTNWRLRQTIQQKTGPVFGMVEARAILLRAQLRHDQPRNLAELSAWLDRYQSQIDLRASLQSSPGDRFARETKAREAAGIPEVVHYGLLLDAAIELARAGEPAAAAKLIWYNRNAPTGMETPEHLLWLASIFAREGGDEMLSSRCRVEGAARARELRDRQDRHVARNLIELPATRSNLLEFGTKDDLLNYVENVLVPHSDSGDVAVIKERVPELDDARKTLFMRNPNYLGIDGIFAASIDNASCDVIRNNWARLLAARENLRTCHRFMGWVISSDLPLTYGRNGFNGCNSAADTVAAWRMLRELHEREGDDERVAQLDDLIVNTGTGGLEESVYDYWD